MPRPPWNCDVRLSKRKTFKIGNIVRRSEVLPVVEEEEEQEEEEDDDEDDDEDEEVAEEVAENASD